MTLYKAVCPSCDSGDILIGDCIDSECPDNSDLCCAGEEHRHGVCNICSNTWIWMVGGDL